MDDQRHDHRCKQWHVTVTIDGDGDHARAVAQMQYHERTLVGVGLTRLQTGAHIPAEVNEELAVGRALSDLTRRLLAATAGDIERVIDDHEAVAVP